MKILVISDSHHSSLSAIPFKKYDAIIHCGDYGNSLEELQRHHIYFVQGNCDSFGKQALHLTLWGRQIFVTHGHKEQVKYGLDNLVYRTMEEGASICMFGHTHQPLCFCEENILFLNPGSFPNSYIEITEDTISLYQNDKVKSMQYRW